MITQRIRLTCNGTHVALNHFLQNTISWLFFDLKIPTILISTLSSWDNTEWRVLILEKCLIIGWLHWICCYFYRMFEKNYVQIWFDWKFDENITNILCTYYTTMFSHASISLESVIVKQSEQLCMIPFAILSV